MAQDGGNSTRKRNDMLIHSLLDAGMSFRTIAKIANCSHGSVSASKKEWLVKKALNPPEEKHQIVEVVIPQPDAALVVAAEVPLEIQEPSSVASPSDPSPT